MTDDLDVQALQTETYLLVDVEVMLACPNCGWVGVVQLYDIGDGPEWCCRGCDQCFPSNAEVGADGLTRAERSLRTFAQQHHEGAPPAGDP